MWRLRMGRLARGWLARRRVFVVVSAVTAAVLACAITVVAVDRPGQNGNYRHGQITILTGGTQGIYYYYGQQLAKAINERLPGVHAEVLSTAASVDNMLRVARGPNIFAFTAADAASAALGGKAPLFAAPVPIRALARLYDDYIHLVVRADAPVHDITDLRDMRVSIGSNGSGTQLIADRLLGVARVTLDPSKTQRLGIDASVAALEHGQIDAFFWSGGLPTAGITALSQVSPIRLVPLGQLAGPLHNIDWAYRSETIPGDTYPLAKDPQDVATVAVPDLIVTRADTDPGLVEAVTRILFEARDEIAIQVPVANALDRRVAISTMPIDLDEGAMRYYRDSKP
jgi:TRAP transporter TAXI family solute receptor